MTYLDDATLAAIRSRQSWAMVEGTCRKAQTDLRAALAIAKREPDLSLLVFEIESTIASLEWCARQAGEKQREGKR